MAWTVRITDEGTSTCKRLVELVDSDGRVIADDEPYYPTPITEADAWLIADAVNGNRRCEHQWAADVAGNCWRCVHCQSVVEGPTIDLNNPAVRSQRPTNDRSTI